MLNDLRYAARMLLQAKGWTAVVVVSLALGIGANTAIFSAINGMLLKKIPVHDPDSLVRLRHAGRNQMATNSSDYGYTKPEFDGQPMRSTFSYPMFQELVKNNQTMTDVIACAPAGRVNVVVNGQAEIATAFVSSGNFYRVLGVQARLGRVILPEDDEPRAAPVAVISDKYWRSRFGSDPAVIDKVVTVNTVQVAVIGVLPVEFTGVQGPVGVPADISFPVSLEPQINPAPPINGVVLNRLSQPTNWWLQIMGRLAPGVTAAQVEGNLGGVFQGAAKAGLDSYLASLDEAARGTSNNRSRTSIPQLRVQSGSRGVYDTTSPNAIRAAGILTGVVALVLLIVCANVANLLLSRATARQKEIAVRLSMGATRTRLVGQLLVESLLLASIGGLLGVAVGQWGRRLVPRDVGLVTPLDWRVLAFVAAITVITGLVFGIAPALRATRADVSSVLKETSRSVVGSRSRLGKALLVLQVAISLVLLVGAGLFLRTVENLRAVDVGFNPRNLVVFRVNPQLNRYDEQRVGVFYQEMLDRIAAIPGVRGVALSNPGLLSGSVNQSSIFVQGRTYGPEQRDSINRLVVSPNFFEVMGMPLLLGRQFTEHENNAKAPRVAIINEAAARKYFADQNPIGQRIGSSLETAGEMEIVGVLRDAKYSEVREAAPPTAYVLHRQTRTLAPTFAVRTAEDPLARIDAIRSAVRAIDPNVPMTDVSTQMEQVERRFVEEKLFAQAYSLFGALALLLAAVGLFGVMSYNVARRTNEIGIRLALGAQRKQVMRATMEESLALVAGGVLMGLAGAIATGRLIASQLYGVPPTDTGTITIAVLVMAAVATLAAYLPARRASRVDPMVALRYE